MSHEHKQIILCVESTEKAKVDSLYIDEILKYFFDIGNDKITYVYLGGKFNYNNEKTKKKIREKIKTYGITEKR